VKKTMVSLLAVLITLAWSLPGFSLLTETELRGEDVGYSPEWLAGLKELVSGEGRVYGSHVISPTFGPSGYESTMLLFAGDHTAFNQVLERYARLKGTRLALVLHPGRGMAKIVEVELPGCTIRLYQMASMRDPGRRNLPSRKKNIPFDWRVRIVHTGWLTKDPERAKGSYVVTVEVWLGGNVFLGDVKVPLNVEVESGGEIEKFIAKHEAKRKQAKKSE